MARVRQAVGVAALASLVVTVIVCAVPAVHFAYHSPGWRVALGTASALVAVFAAFLSLAPLRRPERTDLLLTCALGVVALSSVLVVTLPDDAHTLVAWETRLYSALGALLLAAAAVAPARRLQWGRSATLLTCLALVVATAVTPVLILVLGGRLPEGVRVKLTPTSTSWPDLHSPAAVLVILAIGAVLFAIAAGGFIRRAERHGDEFFAWLAVAAVFATFSRLNYVLFPSRFTDWVYTGDGLWLLFCGVLLIAVMREIRSYWRSAAEAAVLEERRRIAHDLHDGVAQELAYIDRNLRALAPLAGHPSDRLVRLRRAVERAELESRKALAALSVPSSAPLPVLIEHAVTDIAQRFGVEIDLDLASGASVSDAQTEALVRIACEAVANAARHSGAQRIELSLRRAESGVRLRVRDAGRGFDPAASIGGFGLVSMRDRARASGGHLRVESAPGHGTMVEVAL